MGWYGTSPLLVFDGFESKTSKTIVGRPTDTVSKENEGKYFLIVACRCGRCFFLTDNLSRRRCFFSR